MLRVYSETFLPVFIEIGSYLTDKEQKISWQFFETRCIFGSVERSELKHGYENDISKAYSL